MKQTIFPPKGHDGTTSGRLRRIGAVLLLTLPLLAHPLGWFRLGYKLIPFWGDASAAGTAAVGLAASALVCCFPERLLAAFRRDRNIRVLLGTAAVTFGMAVLRQLLFGGPAGWISETLFFLMVPLAGITLAPELKWCLKWYLPALCILLIGYAVGTPDFSGLPGNWNWNWALVAATVPSIFLCFRCPGKWRVIGSCILLGGLLTAFAVLYPDRFPRGVLAGCFGALILLGLLKLTPEDQRLFGAVLIFGLGAGGFLSALYSPAGNLDSRVELWRGAMGLGAHYPLFGVGANGFGFAIPPYLPDGYFFSKFAATWHPHPHNEFFNAFVRFGAAGLFYLILLFWNVARQAISAGQREFYLGWAALLLLIHGCFDVTLTTPLAGTLFGVLAGVSACGVDDAPCPSPVIPGMEKYRRLLPLVWRLAGVLLLMTAAGRMLRDFYAGSDYRQAKVAIVSGENDLARELLARSIRRNPAAESLDTAVQLEMLGFLSPEKALLLLDRMRDLGYENYLHAQFWRGRALVRLGRFQEALTALDQEQRNFPFSARCAALRLAVLEHLQGPRSVRRRAAEHYRLCMKLRGLPPDRYAQLTDEQEDAPLSADAFYHDPLLRGRDR